MPPHKEKMRGNSIIRYIYLYLISAITFIIFVIGAVNIVDTGLKEFVFDIDDYDYARPIPVFMCERHLETEDNEAYENCLLKQKTYEEVEDEKEKPLLSNDAKRRLSIGIAQVLVAFPLWIFHWRRIERDRKEQKK